MQTDTRDTELVPASQAELQRFVTANFRGPKRALSPHGGRTALHYGQPLSSACAPLSTLELNRVVDYPARDMTITVEAGLRVDDLQNTLAKERQQLPIDVPLSHRATVGGSLAANLTGPRRFGYGTWRDYVIGITAVDGTGRMFHSGGRVVKNVAGYDLCKLLIGSLGTLAVVTQVTLKLKPLPESSALVWATFENISQVDQALNRLTTSGARPVILDLLNRQAARDVAMEARCDLVSSAAVLLIGVEGLQDDCRWQVDTLLAELDPFQPTSTQIVSEQDQTRIIKVLTEYRLSAEEPLTFQASVLPSSVPGFVDKATRFGCAVHAHVGDGVVVGHFPDEVSNREKAEAILNPLMDLARQARGTLVMLNADADWKRRLATSDVGPVAPLLRKLKTTFDPHHLLNPGRLVGPP